MMIIGLSLGYSYLNERMFAQMEENGITGLELSCTDENYDMLQLKKLYSEAQKHGVKPGSYHLPFVSERQLLDPSSPDPEVRRATVARFEALIRRAAEEADIRLFVVHPSREPIAPELRRQHLEGSVDAMCQLADIAERNRAVIAVENLPRTCLCNCSGEMKAFLDADGRLMTCFDTNHLLKQDAVEYIHDVGSRIVTTHVSDYDFANERHWLPGEGDIDWLKLMNALKDVGYAGRWLYEVSLPCPKTILRDRDLTPADFAENARELFAGRIPKPVGTRKHPLGMWE